MACLCTNIVGVGDTYTSDDHVRRYATPSSTQEPHGLNRIFPSGVLHLKIEYNHGRY